MINWQVSGFVPVQDKLQNEASVLLLVS